jgi:hypothetical protein
MTDSKIQKLCGFEYNGDIIMNGKWIRFLEEKICSVSKDTTSVFARRD